MRTVKISKQKTTVVFNREKHREKQLLDEDTSKNEEYQAEIEYFWFVMRSKKVFILKINQISKKEGAEVIRERMKSCTWENARSEKLI